MKHFPQSKVQDTLAGIENMNHTPEVQMKEREKHQQNTLK